MKKKNKNLLGRLKSVILLASIIVMGLSATANNITVSNVQHLPNAATNVDTIRFTISWDNSWRNTGTPGTTQNYDGAWVFVKTRPSCSKDSSAPAANYNHAWLLNNISAYPTVSGTTLELGTTDILSSPRAVGIFIYRDADGSGTFTQIVDVLWDRATMATYWGSYNPANAPYIPVDGWDIRVYAIEMVKIPQGSFYLGDASGTSPYGSYCTFGLGNGSSPTQPYSVNGEGQINMGSSSGYLYTRLNSSKSQVGCTSYPLSGTLPAPFPKGYDAFWVMKYEVTQQQITDMMNSFNRAYQYNYVPANNSYRPPMAQGQSNTSNPYWVTGQNPTAPNNPTEMYRNGCYIPKTYDPNAPITFYNNLNNVMDDPTTWNDIDDGQTISCNYLEPKYDLNYGLWRFLDWACLRPMTEMEFEKICRTPGAGLPPMFESPWGLDVTSTANYNYVVSVQNSGRPNEVPTNIGATGLFHGSPNTAPSLRGPRRVGSTYGASTNRVQAGSSYYGVADMAGNLWEVVIAISTTTPNGFTRTATGDGLMNTSGTSYGFPNEWPVTGPTNTTISTNAYMFRGGSWYNDYRDAKISSRYYESASWPVESVGGRGGR